MDEVPAVKQTSRLRRALPWCVGLVILVVLATRVPYGAFLGAIRTGPYIQLGFATLGVTCVILCTDGFSTWIGLRALQLRRPLSRVFLVRGATYALFIINYAVGQGAFGYYLNRTGVSGLRSIGATLFLIGTNLATLLVVTSLVWALAVPGADRGALWWILVIGCAGLAAYLALIVLARRAVSNVQVLAPLFEAGLRGHAIAMLGRLPHTAAMVMGHWVALRVWGIPVPVTAGITLMPAVVIASVLPISPSGLGTTQAALVYFFSQFAPGTPEQRHAYVLAFSIVYFVYGVLASLAVGLACTPFAKRYGLLPTRQDQAAGDTHPT